MAASSLRTDEPAALRCLMTETLFDIGVVPEQSVAGTIPQPDTPIADPLPPLTGYGKNARHFLFLTDDGQHEWLSPAAMDAFGKTLSALGLSADDIVLVNMARQAAPVTKAALIALFSPRTVVIFGASVDGWGTGEPDNTVSVVNGISVFRTYRWEELLADVNKKRAFWATMKQLFS